MFQYLESWRRTGKLNRTRSNRAHRRCLCLQPLETRWLLATFQVTTELDVVDTMDGQTSLREAVIQANALAGQDTILFDGSLANKAVMLTGRIDVTDPLTIQGLGAGLTIINGQNKSRLFNNTNHVTLDGLTLTGGQDINNTPFGGAAGGAIFQSAGQLTIQNCIISGNSAIGLADQGSAVGGAIVSNGTVVVINSTISGNSAVAGNVSTGFASGGGIWASGVIVTDSTISGNSVVGKSSQGGGIRSSAVTVTNSTISANSTMGTFDSSQSKSIGGGIFAIGPATINNSTVSGNSSTAPQSLGGGIYSTNKLTVTNSTITGNSVSGSSVATGGGVWSNVDTRIFNSIIAGNATNKSGSAPDLQPSGATQIVQYSLIGDNTGSGLAAAPVGAPDPSGNLVGGAGAARIDPLLRPLQDTGGPTRTRALRPGSPALNAGLPDFVSPPDYDQRGAPFARISNGLNNSSGPRLDMGAYEFQSSPGSLIVDTAMDGDDGNYAAGNLSLREALDLANYDPGLDTITFAPALAGQPVLVSLGQITISGPLTIQGLAADQTIIDGRNNSRLFDITTSAGVVTFDGLTLTGGKTTAASERGGAIRSASTGRITIQNSTITGNSTTGNFSRGGAIATGTSLLSIINSTVSGNSTSGFQAYGGGVFANFTLEVTNSTIAGNSTTGPTSGGGGIFAGFVTVTASTISGNSTATASSPGGGIFINGTLGVYNSTISGNSTLGDGSNGGGISSTSPVNYQVILTNSTITGNSVAGTNTDGGGVFRTSGPLAIRNSIIAGNRDLQDGSVPDLRPGGTLTTQYNLIGDNNGTGLAAAPVALAPDFNLVGTHSSPLNPLLGALANNGGPTMTHATLPGSPARNAGDPGFVAPPSADQRGAPFVRVRAGRIDMGAFEDGNTFIVNSIADTADANPGDGLALDASGKTTLRAAIQEANASAGTQTIAFNIPGDGVKTISPTSALPTITDPLIIDATTQPGFVSAPRIQLAGNLAGTGVNGLNISDGGSTVKGLAINRFAAAGIRLSSGGNNTIAGNYIGTNPAGTAALANGTSGLLVVNSANNTIGGFSAADRNVLSGNTQHGVSLSGAGSTGNIVQGNRIGTSANGTTDLGNLLSGVLVSQSGSNTIGGTSAAARNLISGNDQYGIYLSGTGATGNLIQGNRIGTNLAGTAALANTRSGVYVNQAPGNTIGGSTVSARNLISGNSQYGVLINGTSASSNVVQRNFIGTNAAGTAALGNALDGVRIVSGTLNQIGGSTSLGNTIAFNGKAGVTVLGTGARNAIQGNTLFDNVKLGIDLNSDGVTANDAGDADTGPNKLQNFPMITTAVLSGANLNLTYSVASNRTNSSYPLTIEFFLADSSGQEGKTSLGRNTYASSSATLSKTATIAKGSAVLGSKIVATATDAQGNTSEFSASATVANPLQAAAPEGVCHAVTAATALTQVQLQPVVEAAITRLSAQGLTPWQREQLSAVTVEIGDLPGSLLGLATPQTITLDAMAAGYGWFIDPTPLDDAEFVTGSGSSTFDSRARMDLLTAVMHELGHTLGLDDLDDHGSEAELMYQLLAVGIRRIMVSHSEPR